VTGTDGFGCSNSASVTVTVNPLPDITAMAEPSAVCAGNSSLITASGASRYAWSTGETQPGISVSPAETTNYYVTGTNEFGCQKGASLTVTVNDLPQISVTASNPNVCSGDFTFLTATGATNYTWSTGETGSQIGVRPYETTTYLITGTDDRGCSSSTLFTISTGPSITVTASASEICAGEHVFLSANGATDYQWSTGEPGPNIVVQPSETTTYRVTATDDKGCTATSDVPVVVRPPLSISVTASDPEICAGGFTFLTASGATDYLWSTGETGARIGVSPTQTTTYLVTGTDENGCSGSTSYTVAIGPVVTATTSLEEMCEGDYAFLTASGATSYLWSTGDTSPEIFVSPGQSTTYVVTGTNDQGCTGSASVAVNVIDCSSPIGRTRSVTAGPAAEQEAIRPVAEEAQPSLYPNPTNGIFYVKGSPAGASMEVFNAMGERVAFRKIDAMTEVNLAGYDNGLYLVRVKHNGALIYNARIFKE
jgi:hypothetical protein